jgi:hypothetical protein
MNALEELMIEELKDAEIAVNQGVVYLDGRKPGWYNDVDIDDLDMMDCDKCIIGYVFGEDEWERLYDRSGSSWITEHSFAQNGDVWIKTIEARRAR